MKLQIKTFLRAPKFNALFLFLAGIAAMGIVSRAADSFMVPSASIASPEEMRLKYPLEIQGRIAPKEHLAIFCPEGLRIAQVHAPVNSVVEKGGLLFSVDLGSLQGCIRQTEEELQKLNLQIEDLTQSWHKQARQRSLDFKRAKEDYSDTETETGHAVNAARLELEQAEAELALHNSQKPADNASQPHSTTMKGPEKLAATPGCALPEEGSPMDAWAAKQLELEQTRLEKQKLYEEAAAARSKALKAAARQVEDASQPVSRDNSAALLQIGQTELNQALQELEELCKAGGKVYSNYDGQVIECSISTGSLTSLEPAMVLSDFHHPFQFEGTLEEAALLETGAAAIEEGMEGTLQPEGGNAPLGRVRVASVSQGEDGQYRITAGLTSDGASKPEAASLTLEKESKRYPCCVPLSALCSKESGDFVLRVQETPTILGVQATAEYVPVDILEQNSQYAAVEGALSTSDRIIVTASKTVKEGERIRIIED